MDEYARMIAYWNWVLYSSQPVARPIYWPVPNDVQHPEATPAAAVAAAERLLKR